MKKKMIYIMNVEWNWIKQRPHFIAEELSEEYEIIILYQYKYGRKGLQKRDSNGLKIKPVYLIPKISGNEKLRCINDKIFASKIKRIIKREKPEYLFLTYPTQIDVIPNNYDGKIIYDCMDNHMAFLKNKSEANKLLNKENKLMDKATYIFASAQKLKDTLLERSNVDESKICLVRNAYNGDMISIQHKTNEEINDKCRVAYVGTISEWFDWDVILESIKRNNNIEYHLFGPIHMTDIPELPNIVYHGTVEHSEIYNAIKNMDGLIMPFIVNEIIESVDPVKLYEYINFNKTIIVCYYKEIERFAPFVEFYNNVDEFCICLDNLFVDNNPKYQLEEGRDFLVTNTWNSRGKQMIRFIENR